MKPYFYHIVHYFQRRSKKSNIQSGVGVLLLSWFIFSSPAQLFNAPTSFVITDKDGHLLNASIAADGQWRFPNNNQVPEKFAQCITHFEDKRFFYHPGIDPVAICRAIKQNLTNKKTVSGGSTITMQVIRLHKQHKKRNLWNKLTESILAIRLECSYRKKTIMALYASNAPFGGNVVGLEAASWRYFGRAATQLSWGEMAALAVLPNAPALVHPGKNSAILLRKRNDLLDKLAADQIIDLTTAQLSKMEPLPGEPKPLPQLAPHLLDRFKKDFALLKKDNPQLVSAIQTTIDGDLQTQVNHIIDQHALQLKGSQIKNAAAMVLDIATGNVLTYIGNVYHPQDSSIESHVDILASVRSPGSTLKPLLYAALLHEGGLLPKQLVADIPTQIGGYAPQNFDLGYDGAVPANKALARSLNIPAVKMLQQYKYQRFYNLLKQCGLSTLHQPADHYGMSLILGGCEINPYELAGVYASMARTYLKNNQIQQQQQTYSWLPPNYIKSKINPSTTAFTPPHFSNVALWHTFNAMNEVMRPGEEGLWSLFTSAQRIAWKTGTSFGFRDGWAIGFNTQYCVLVWVGNTTGEGRPELTGINTAAPILFDIFRILPTSDWFTAPTHSFTYINVCRHSGYKLSNDCDSTDKVKIPENTNITNLCPYCKKINLDRTATYRVTESCESPSFMQHQSFFVLPPTIEYYYKQKHSNYKILPNYKPGCAIDEHKILDIIYPDDDAKMMIPKEITGAKGKTVFTATHKNATATLFWHIDDTYIATTQRFHQISINPNVGKHLLTIVDEQGNTVSKTFEVIASDR